VAAPRASRRPSEPAAGRRPRPVAADAAVRRRQTALARAIALHLPAPPGRLYRQEKGKPAKDDPAKREAERIGKLEADFAAATAKPDWGRAAVLLNGFDDAGIQGHLGKLSGTDQAEIRYAAPKAMPGYAERVVTNIDALNADAKRVSLVIAALKAEALGAMPGWSDNSIAIADWKNLTTSTVDEYRAY
jgi:hypothetical protein